MEERNAQQEGLVEGYVDVVIVKLTTKFDCKRYSFPVSPVVACPLAIGGNTMLAHNMQSQMRHATSFL